MYRAMTTTFATTRIFRGISEHDAFTDQTYDLIDAFHDELAQTTGGQPLSNAVVMASDLLLDTYGAHASWQRFEMDAFFSHAVTNLDSFFPYFPRFKTTLIAFLEFLARRGIVTSEVPERARFVPAPMLFRNRLERRIARSLARRARQPVPGEEDVRVLLPREAAETMEE
jgi:hypothetical protein